VRIICKGISAVWKHELANIVYQFFVKLVGYLTKRLLLPKIFCELYSCITPIFRSLDFSQLLVNMSTSADVSPQNANKCIIYLSVNLVPEFTTVSIACFCTSAPLWKAKSIWSTLGTAGSGGILTGRWGKCPHFQRFRHLRYRSCLTLLRPGLSLTLHSFQTPRCHYLPLQAVHPFEMTLPCSYYSPRCTPQVPR